MQAIRLNKLKIHWWWKTKLVFSLPFFLVISFLWVPAARADLPYYEGVEMTVSNHPPTWYNLMTYDSLRDNTVLVIATIATQQYSPAETWIWDGTNWSNANVYTPEKAEEICFDSHRGVAVLYAQTLPGSPGEIWEWDGTNWQLVDSNGPTSRESFGMAYDENRQVTVLIGGHAENQSVYPGNTWEWDGTSWNVYDTQEYWPNPNIIFAAIMAYDAKRQVVVLHNTSNDITATWDGLTWQLFDATPDVGGSGSRIVYDRRRERVILFGGYTNFVDHNDLWEWDGLSWIQLEIESPPPPRSYHSMAYDSTRYEVLIYGGAGTSTHFFDTWALRISNVWVDYSYTGFETGDFDTPFNSLHEAVEETSEKGVIALKAGTGNESIVITKPVWLKAPLGPVVIRGY